MSDKDQPPTERRHFSRVRFSARGEITQDLQRAEVIVVDLSLQGVMIRAFDTQGFDLARPLQLTIPLAENARIDMTLVVAHRGAEVMGFTCQTIDEVSIGHLRRLIELNLGDASAADRELAELFNRPE